MQAAKQTQQAVSYLQMQQQQLQAIQQQVQVCTPATNLLKSFQIIVTVIVTLISSLFSPLLNSLFQGASSPWNIGAAYRVPDSNINLSCTYQQGRASIQVLTFLFALQSNWRKKQLFCFMDYLILTRFQFCFLDQLFDE